MAVFLETKECIEAVVAWLTPQIPLQRLRQEDWLIAGSLREVGVGEGERREGSEGRKKGRKSTISKQYSSPQQIFSLGRYFDENTSILKCKFWRLAWVYFSFIDLFYSLRNHLCAQGLRWWFCYPEPLMVIWEWGGKQAPTFWGRWFLAALQSLGCVGTRRWAVVSGSAD